MKKFNLFIVLFFCVVGLFSIQADEPSIIGRWAITYSPENKSERDKYMLHILEISNTTLSFSVIDILRPGGNKPYQVTPYSIRDNLLVFQDGDPDDRIEYELNGNFLSLNFNGVRYIDAIRLARINKISGLYHCYKDSSDFSLEILDYSNVLVTTAQGGSYNQQSGKYIIAGKYFILTLNGVSYSFEILENNAVLFGKTQGLQGAFVNVRN